MFRRISTLIFLASILFNVGGRLNAANDAASPSLELRTEFAYEAIVEISAAVEVGETPKGHQRYIPITGGSFRGEKLQGIVLSGGADWQTDRSDGVTEVNALYSIKCDDGTVVVVHNGGVISEGGKYLRTAARFEAPKGPHDWLNRAQFVGSISGGPRPGTVTIRIFRVL